MSNAAPMGYWRRLENYARQNGGDHVALTPAQDRRRIHKERRETGSHGGVWIVGGKNRPTPRRKR
jgi:hypothetical protein